MFPSGDWIVWTSVTGPCFGAHAAIKAAVAIAVSIFFILVVLCFRSPTGSGMTVAGCNPLSFVFYDEDRLRWNYGSVRNFAWLACNDINTTIEAL